jgi:hypothetical protein
MATYLKDFNVSGVLVLQRNIGLSDKENRDFIRQIEAAGFTRLAPLDPGVESYIRTDVRDAAQAAGFRNELLRDVSLVPSTHQPSGPTVPSVEFLKVFDRGKLNSVVPAGTPNGRGVLTLSWPDAQPAITVVSGYNYTFSRVRLGARPILIFDVARAFSRGQSALAWIDITPKVGKTLRLFSAICPPADGTKPRWRHVAVPFPLKNATVNVTFGTSSLPGGGIADWIAYADPVLQDARMQ